MPIYSIYCAWNQVNTFPNQVTFLNFHVSDYLPGVALVVAVGELVANIVGTDRRSLMDSGSTLRPPMVPFSEAFLRTRIASSIGTTSLKIMVKDTTTLPFLSRKKKRTTCNTNKQLKHFLSEFSDTQWLTNKFKPWNRIIKNRNKND